ncbi:hypothetical protein SAMN05421644_1514 [Allochromatium warmingii]|uniref:Uncharacterized protein n=1 Tax=Allochromatium warmingii TaxID=61595 RepID=A0A1H3J1Z6_ALLWA|nr:hypothetical protein SAMN05421644_1514 [Allochromatium warmingii]
MGIRNADSAPTQERRRPLITPHGDSEPVLAYTSDEAATSHNPSWGFGTCGCRCAARRKRAHNPSWGFGTPTRCSSDHTISDLITPHGDSERHSIALKKCAVQSHNPSWGFGTPIFIPDSLHQIHLITPHGDSERPLKQCGLARPSSHNPSWGFGTLFCADI